MYFCNVFSKIAVKVMIASNIVDVVITGPPNGPVSFCSLASVMLPAGRKGAWAVGQPTLHSGQVRLHPIRAAPCFVTFFVFLPFPSNRQHVSYGDCLEGKWGDYLTSAVLLCIIIVHIICTPI